MPRPRQAFRRGNRNLKSRGFRRGLDSSFIPFARTSSHRAGHRGLTLQEEARNTASHHDANFSNSDSKLRYSKVKFVSAGALESTEHKDTQSALARTSLWSPGDALYHAGLDDENDAMELTSSASDRCHIPKSPQVDDQITFVIDTKGGEPVQTGLPPPRFRSTSPTPSDSSEEVILFRGRNQQGDHLPVDPRKGLPKINRVDMNTRVAEDAIEEQVSFLGGHLYQSPANTDQMTSSHVQISRNELRTNQNLCNQKQTRKDEEDALMSDYLANIEPVYENTWQSFSKLELGGSSQEHFWHENQRSSRNSKTTKQLRTPWGRSDICDFEDLSTYDGVMGEVQQILSKRNRTAGIQYLVVCQDQTADQARWVPVTTLVGKKAVSLIKAFEADEQLLSQFIDNLTDMVDSLDTDAGGDTAAEDYDPIHLQIPFSDAKIARLLAKQEELGMDSSEVVLFDEGIDIDKGETITCQREKYSLRYKPNSAMLAKTKKKHRGSTRERDDFSSVALQANLYDGFDIMDFDRPSLRRKPKGRKGKTKFDVSGSDFEVSLQMAKHNDRLKKKKRKQEREELRARGLLGKRNSKPDLKQKYNEGMGISAVKEEIKNFLISNNTSLALPPMAKADRRIVHELANTFRLKSKSTGNGSKRYPILYRTKQTSILTENCVDAVETRLTRRFFPRMDVGRKGSGTGLKSSARGGFCNSAVSYRDGDVVGGSAPELAADNKGRAILERMGWSSGTALGAVNNKGILQPVSHVVKTSKAGLG